MFQKHVKFMIYKLILFFSFSDSNLFTLRKPWHFANIKKTYLYLFY